MTSGPGSADPAPHSALISVRAAVPADIPALARIFREASLSNDGDRAVLLAHPEALDFPGDGVAAGRTRVAVIDGTVVGFATLSGSPPVPELEDLFTAPRWMRHGVARALVGDAVELARAAGASAIGVVANAHALPFYRAVGFEPDGTAQTEFGPAARLRRAIGGRHRH